MQAKGSQPSQWGQDEKPGSGYGGYWGFAIKGGPEGHRLGGGGGGDAYKKFP